MNAGVACSTKACEQALAAGDRKQRGFFRRSRVVGSADDPGQVWALSCRRFPRVRLFQAWQQSCGVLRSRFAVAGLLSAFGRYKRLRGSRRSCSSYATSELISPFWPAPLNAHRMERQQSYRSPGIQRSLTPDPKAFSKTLNSEIGQHPSIEVGQHLGTPIAKYTDTLEIGIPHTTKMDSKPFYPVCSIHNEASCTSLHPKKFDS